MLQTPSETTLPLTAEDAADGQAVWVSADPVSDVSPRGVPLSAGAELAALEDVLAPPSACTDAAKTSPKPSAARRLLEPTPANQRQGTNSQGAKAHGKRDQRKRPRTCRRGIGRKSHSVWTVCGGLPSFGKRR